MPATIALIIAFFVLTSADKAKGNMQKFGKVLGKWIIILALLFVANGVYGQITGKCAMMDMKMKYKMKYMGMMKDGCQNCTMQQRFPQN